MKRFQRKKENFICEVCGKKVEGNGYTNHCPYCLWSKHVDIWPGDRLNPCQGLMEPIKVFWKEGKWRLKHQCQKCGKVNTVITSSKDNRAVLIEIVEKMKKE